MQKSNESLVVRIWPDNTWAIVEDISEGEYDWRSDDYYDVDMYDFNAFASLEPALRDEIVFEVMG